MDNKHQLDLTEGIIWKQLLIFVWPVFVSNIFQRFYEITNQLIVGNYVSRDALSAVSSVSSITMIFTQLFMGISLGAGIMAAYFYGARRTEKLKGVVESSLILTVGGGVISTAIIELLIPLLLKAINVNETLYPLALSYLRVYVLGNAAVFTYNMCFQILRSIGDTRKPLFYLVISSVINLVLGIIFVRVFNLSVIGTALATIISQLVVDILCIRVIARNPLFGVDLRRPRADREILKEICRIGIPAGIQNMTFSVSHLMIQSYINMFDNATIAGIGVAEKVSSWVQVPLNALNTINTAYIAQNYGAKKYDRVQEGIRTALAIIVSITMLTAGGIYLVAEPLVAMFNRDPQVIKVGCDMVRFVVFSFVGNAVSHIYNGACRATGNVRVPLILSVFSLAVVKYVIVAVWLNRSFDVRAIYYATAVSCILAGTLSALYFHTSSWTRKNHLRA
ncbi:MAG: MATE family efflux transporter [Erysipelotrichaceae bacterium]|nr:MATE family efflux transporter [Erysipelotrichaceae bacterium]